MRKEEIISVLNRAEHIIERGGHCQHADARDLAGRRVFPTDRSAASWSVTGALLLAARKADGVVFLDALYAFGLALGICDMRINTHLADQEDARRVCERLWRWEDEDNRTAAQIVAVFNLAKEKLNGRQAEAPASDHRSG